ncbi:MAG: hypothetical protein L6265_12030 [Thermoplasmatales archaeon]|nr:hypothetical protein [Candidatus Methanoperedenaceae archaeon]MCG2827308.1 hypothetical protein [Thermoplasmatales archaeon]
MKITAVFLEVASIQQYVFGSNKLKENLGASYLVENIFKDNLKTAFERISLKLDLNEWLKNPDQIHICEQGIEAEIGYIGGGNALLLFKENDFAVKLARQWSKNLLIETPGLVPSIAISDLECAALSDSVNFQLEMDELLNKLRINKNNYQPQTALPRHGITAECSHTGLSAECYDKDDKTYISSVAGSKIANAENAKKEMNFRFRDVLKDEFDFPDKLDKLGQKEGDNHISIVHIDGNSMGSRFRDCKTLMEIRHLSRAVSNATESSFKDMLNEMIQKYDYLMKNFELPDNMLPIRPIIMGGDDVTFVSHGKLGIYLAEIFMKSFSKKTVSDNKPISSCAGIAITKTKYPFFRGYELAEDLCSQAKKRYREEKDKNSSWLDFHIAYGGFSGSIEEIRNKNFKVSEGNLCLRPYRVEGGDDYRNFSECIDGSRYLKISGTKWPNSKLAELRAVLGQGIPAIEMFIKEMEYRDRELPVIKTISECKKRGWTYVKTDGQVKVTPYFDMLELMEFYPLDIADYKRVI